MKKFLFVILCVCCLAGCSSVNELNQSTKLPVNLPINYKTRISVKEYKIKGSVRGEYTRTCILMGLICSGGVYIYDDLIQKAEKIGGNSVVNMVVDTESSSPFWYLLYSKKTYRANGLAIEITKTDTRARELYGDD